MKSQGYSVVREYTGHGIGRQMHEDPQIPNYSRTPDGGRVRLRPGMTFALEPMVNVGDWQNAGAGRQLDGGDGRWQTRRLILNTLWLSPRMARRS